MVKRYVYILLNLYYDVIWNCLLKDSLDDI